MWTAKATTHEDLTWLIERVGCYLTPAAKGVKVVDGLGQIRAMAVFDRWMLNCAEAHIAVDEPMALRTLCREAFPWYFAQRGVLLGIVRATNTKALRLDKHLGFKETSRIKDGVDVGEDLIILSMRREGCRWVRPIVKSATQEVAHGRA
jgi:hypothetical protein